MRCASIPIYYAQPGPSRLSVNEAKRRTRRLSRLLFSRGPPNTFIVLKLPPQAVVFCHQTQVLVHLVFGLLLDGWEVHTRAVIHDHLIRFD